MIMGYHHTLWNDLKWSVKQNPLWIVAMDLLMYVILILGVKISGMVMYMVASSNEAYQFVAEYTISPLAYEQFREGMMGALYWLFAEMLIIAVITFLILFLAYCATRAVIWNVIVHKKPSLQHFKLFIKGNLAWLVIIFPSLLVFSAIYLAIVMFVIHPAAFFFFAALRFSTPILDIILLLVQALYFFVVINITFVFYYELVRHRKVSTALKSMFSLHVRRGHHFLVPYLVVMFVVAVIAVLSSWLLQMILVQIGSAPSTIQMVATVWTFILTLVLLVWWRFVVDVVVQRLSGEKPQSEVRITSVKRSKKKAPQKRTAKSKKATKKTKRSKR
jgi:hypothetical protein